MNELQIFENTEFGEIRGIEISGEPWLVLKDVCAAFGEQNYRRVAARLDDEEKGVSQIATPGGRQHMIVVNESGVYSTLFAMQPQKANGVTDEYIAERQEKLKTFKRWVTHEVIPSIRKHGAYMTPETIEKALLDPDTVIRLAIQLKEERQRRRMLEEKVEEDKQKVIFADAVSASKTTILVGELAKLLRQNGVEMGQNRLFKWLRDKGYLMKTGSSQNTPTQRAMELGLFSIKETTIAHADGYTEIKKTTKITPKGQQYFINLFLKQKEVLA